jgi:hypothetical protein
MEAAGIEPVSCAESTVNCDCGCVNCQHAGAARALHPGGLNCHCVGSLDADQQCVIAAWDGLPSASGDRVDCLTIASVGSPREDLRRPRAIPVFRVERQSLRFGTPARRIPELPATFVVSRPRRSTGRCSRRQPSKRCDSFATTSEHSQQAASSPFRLRTVNRPCVSSAGEWPI